MRARDATGVGKLEDVLWAGRRSVDKEAQRRHRPAGSLPKLKVQNRGARLVVLRDQRATIALVHMRLQRLLKLHDDVRCLLPRVNSHLGLHTRGRDLQGREDHTQCTRLWWWRRGWRGRGDPPPRRVRRRDERRWRRWRRWRVTGWRTWRVAGWRRRRRGRRRRGKAIKRSVASEDWGQARIGFAFEFERRASRKLKVGRIVRLGVDGLEREHRQAFAREQDSLCRVPDAVKGLKALAKVDGNLDIFYVVGHVHGDLEQTALDVRDGVSDSQGADRRRRWRRRFIRRPWRLWRWRKRRR